MNLETRLRVTRSLGERAYSAVVADALSESPDAEAAAISDWMLATNNLPTSPSSVLCRAMLLRLADLPANTRESVLGCLGDDAKSALRHIAHSDNERDAESAIRSLGGLDEAWAFDELVDAALAGSDPARSTLIDKLSAGRDWYARADEPRRAAASLARVHEHIEPATDAGLIAAALAALAQAPAASPIARSVSACYFGLDTPASQAARAVIRDPSFEITIQPWRLLWVDALAAACAHALEHAQDTARWLERGGTRAPWNQRAVRGLLEKGRVPDAHSIIRGGDQRAACALVGCCGDAGERSLALLENALCATSAPVRLLAVHAARSNPDPAGTLVDAIFDADTCVSHAAVLGAVARRGALQGEDLHRAARSARRVPGRSGALDTFIDTCARTDARTPAGRFGCRRAHRRDRNAFVAEARRALARANPAEAAGWVRRLAAVDAVRELASEVMDAVGRLERETAFVRCVGAHADDLIAGGADTGALFGSDDACVRWSAVKSLASGGAARGRDDTRRGVIDTALSDDEAGVRAAGIVAAAALARRHRRMAIPERLGRALVDLLTDGDKRTRSWGQWAAGRSGPGAFGSSTQIIARRLAGAASGALWAWEGAGGSPGDEQVDDRERAA